MVIPPPRFTLPASFSVGLSAWRWACALPRCGSRDFRIARRIPKIRTRPQSETDSDFVGLVREAGVEPARPCEHWHLKPASLPIPPLAHPDLIVALAQRKRDNTTAGRPCQQLFSKNFIFFFGGWSEGRGDSRLGRPPPHPSFAPQMPPSPPQGGRLCGRPHGAAPTAYPARPSCRGGPACPPKTWQTDAPSSVTAFGRATFPPRGRSGAPGRPRPTWSAPFVGADVLIGPRRGQSPTPSGLRPSPPDRGSRPPPYRLVFFRGA